MEIHQLRYFCAVARTGSFTRAADDEGVAQPTLSQQIRKLEADLGTPLFERLGRSVRLTPGGERLLSQARSLLRQLADARHSVQELKHETRGRLTVGSIPTITPYMVAPRLPEFQRLYPDVDLHLYEHTTSQLVDGLQCGDVDVAILSLPLSHPEIICSELFREPLLLALSLNHRLAAMPAIEVRELRSDRLLVLREGHCFRDLALKACRRGRFDPLYAFEGDHLSSIMALASAGFGISVIPEMAASHAHGCRLVPLRGSDCRRIGYAQARKQFVPPAQKAFISWLRALPVPMRAAASS